MEIVSDIYVNSNIFAKIIRKMMAYFLINCELNAIVVSSVFQFDYNWNKKRKGKQIIINLIIDKIFWSYIWIAYADKHDMCVSYGVPLRGHCRLSSWLYQTISRPFPTGKFQKQTGLRCQQFFIGIQLISALLILECRSSLEFIPS